MLFVCLDVGPTAASCCRDAQRSTTGEHASLVEVQNRFHTPLGAHGLQTWIRRRSTALLLSSAVIFSLPCKSTMRVCPLFAEDIILAISVRSCLFVRLVSAPLLSAIRVRSLLAQGDDRLNISFSR